MLDYNIMALQRLLDGLQRPARLIAHGTGALLGLGMGGISVVPLALMLALLFGMAVTSLYGFTV
ncbi:MAG: hypothetical protein HC779_08865, partial [Phyllobacteriaceae bacterium]|nr:hypothetical protein [Phyllobacteriaceae bacterium]